MTDTATQTVVQATKPQSDDVPAWKELIVDVEIYAGSFWREAEELVERLDRFEWEDDVPEEVQEAATEASLAIWAGLMDAQRRLSELYWAVNAADHADSND
jgi:hypothetical protein